MIRRFAPFFFFVIASFCLIVYTVPFFSVYPGSSLALTSSEQDFPLRFVDSTAVGIVFTWSPLSNVSHYVIERSTDNSRFSSLYSVSSSQTLFEDTGWPINHRLRFAQPSEGSGLSSALNTQSQYYYRIKAVLGNRTEVISNTIGPVRLRNFSSASDVPRGVVGDLYADVVIGKPDFSHNVWWGTDERHVKFGGGVVIDRFSTPQRVYFIDVNNNRVLGLSRAGVCAGSSHQCTVNSDCGSQGVCTPQPGSLAADIVFGQPNFSSSGCNRDGTRQIFPKFTSPSAASLCFMNPDQISVGETVILLSGSVDARHNLYIPDIGNHRILMYRDPFSTDTIADDVWGQVNFSEGKCNRGAGRTLSSLCFVHEKAGVDIDAQGNLWVADSGNNRILRFPRSSGQQDIAKTADVELLGVSSPSSVRVTDDGKVYVTETFGNLVVFNPVSTSTVQGYRNLTPRVLFSRPSVATGGLSYDRTNQGLWFQQIGRETMFFDLNRNTVTRSITYAGNPRGVDVSVQGDVFWMDAWNDDRGIFRVSFADLLRRGSSTPWNQIGDPIFGTYGYPSLDTLHHVTGITTVGKQLLITDGWRVLLWNNYDTLASGKAADSVWGFRGRNLVEWHPNRPVYGSLKTDAQGRVWVSSLTDRKIHVFSPGPIYSYSQPIFSIDLRNVHAIQNNTVARLADDLHPSFQDYIYFEPTSNGSQFWLSDENRGRVLRFSNVGQGKTPYVDIVLGQPTFSPASSSYATCNRGRGPSAISRDTLCRPNVLRTNQQGDLFVTENATGGMDGGASRVLYFSANSFPQNISSVNFNILPEKVFGTSHLTDFITTGDCGSDEPACTLQAIDVKNGIMISGGGNPYVATRFPLIFLTPGSSSLPSLALGDRVSFPSISHIDQDGNLYFGDYDWHRVLMYKKPIPQELLREENVLAIPTSTPSTPISTPTSTTPATSWLSSSNQLYTPPGVNRVGLGATNPDAPLTLQGVATIPGVDLLAILRDSNGNRRWHINFKNGGLNFTESNVSPYRLFFSPGGNIGLSTDNPQARLDVNGTVRVGSLPTDPTGVNGMIYYNNSLQTFRCHEAGTWKDCF